MLLKEQFRELPYDIRYGDYDIEKKDIEDFYMPEWIKQPFESINTGREEL